MAHSSFMQGLWFIPSLIFGAVQGFSSGNWQMFLFAALSLIIWPLGRWLKHNREFAIDGAVVVDGTDVWIGDHRLPRSEFLWRRQWHGVVWDALNATAAADSLLEMLDRARGKGFRGSAPGTIWVGVDGLQNVEFDLVVDGPHLLVVGATGTGKSELLRLMISGWLNQDQRVDLTLIDFKGGATMARFAGNPRVIGLATDLERTDVLAVATTLERQLTARQALLADSEVSSIEELHRIGGALNRQVIVIDEFGELLRQHPRIVQVLEQVASRGRSLGMHLVVANQSMAGVSRTLLVNLRARVAIGEMDPIDFSQLGFRTRTQGTRLEPKWRTAKMKTGNALEIPFAFPIGF
jgi:hypothetical protein